MTKNFKMTADQLYEAWKKEEEIARQAPEHISIILTMPTMHIIFGMDCQYT